MNKHSSISTDVPIGFGLSLAANPQAMRVFSSMTEEEKQQVIAASRQQETKEDMLRFVEELTRLS